MNVVRTARLATGPPTSMPIERRTDLMGAARPQTPRRSPRQAFGGTKDQRHKVANKRKTEHQGTRRTSVMKCSRRGFTPAAYRHEFFHTTALYSPRHSPLPDAMGLIPKTQTQLTGITEPTRRSQDFHPKGLKSASGSTPPPTAQPPFLSALLVLDSGTSAVIHRGKSAGVQMPPTRSLPNHQTLSRRPLSGLALHRALRAFHLHLYAPPFNIHFHRLHFPSSFKPNKRSIKFDVPASPHRSRRPFENATESPEEPIPYHLKRRRRKLFHE